MLHWWEVGTAESEKQRGTQSVPASLAMVAQLISPEKKLLSLAALFMVSDQARVATK